MSNSNTANIQICSHTCYVGNEPASEAIETIQKAELSNNGPEPSEPAVPKEHKHNDPKRGRRKADSSDWISSELTRRFG